MNRDDANELPVPRAAGRVAEAAKAVAHAAQDLEQLALLDDLPFEEAMCLSPEEVTKRYTAENARQIEWRREACIKLLARQCPASDIGDILKMNHRTVAAIAAQEGQKIAGFSEQFAQTLVASAASDIALAETKKHSASHKDLHYSAGVKLSHAAAFKMIGVGTGEDGGAIELEKEDSALQSARKFLEAKKAVAAVGTPPPSKTHDC